MIKGILFDKDGTLIDFFSLWLDAAMEVVPEFLKQNKLDSSEEMIDYILRTIGVTEMKVDPAGALAYKSYTEIAAEIQEALLEKGYLISEEKIQNQIEALFHKSVTRGYSRLQQLTDIKKMIAYLQEKQIHVGLATADTLDSARACLDSMEVLEQFDYVGADDGIRKPKPEKDMFLEFQEQFGLLAEEIAVVGDSYNDIVFAKRNGGIAIGVLSGVSQAKDFQDEADFIISSIQELPELLKQI